MFDIGWSEIFVVVVLAIIVIGPKDLPRVMRTAGRWVRKARLMASEFQEQLERMAQEAEIDEVKKSIHHISNFDIKTAVEKTVDPADNLTGSFTEPPILKGETPAKPEGKAATLEPGTYPAPVAMPVVTPETPGARGANGSGEK